MASLKEIKGRIASVKSTQKITSAMKMVASAKLRKIQYQAERFQPYANRLAEALDTLLSADAPDDFRSPFAEGRETKRAGVVVFSAHSGLCGAFNSNVLGLLAKTLDEYRSRQCETLVYPAGKKAEEVLRKWPYPIETPESFARLTEKPTWEGAGEMANRLSADFLSGRIDRVDFVYNHFKSMAVQQPLVETFLPLAPPPPLPAGSPPPAAYLAEPDRESLLSALIPQALQSKLYAVLLDSAAAEQAARTIAMQIATDNVDDILDELITRLNKQRQQAISNEILDILGGSEALNK
jgi:F-type H+-transporting ATPase subunit gamma